MQPIQRPVALPGDELVQAHESPHGKPRCLIRALGTAKGAVDWSRNRRCQVTAATIRRKILAGWRPDDAITTPPVWLVTERDPTLLASRRC